MRALSRHVAAARSSSSMISSAPLLFCRRASAAVLYNCARDAQTVALFCETPKDTARDKHVSTRPKYEASSSSSFPRGILASARQAAEKSEPSALA